MIQSSKTAASTAQQDDADQEIADSLATALVRAGVPAVLGWEGWVYDHEATDFAEMLYRELGNRNSLEQAIGNARRHLLSNGARGQASRDWHLARLWLGPEGGGPIVGGKRKRTLVSANRGFKEFLDKRANRSPVASREAFVGRRREIQTGLRVLRDDDYAGLLIHGMGRIGKSSLAARLANRLGNEYAIAVVFEHYAASSVFESIYEAVKPHQTARELLDTVSKRIQDDPVQLEGILLDLLSGPCAQKDEQGPPLLLIIDDLERILDEPQPGSQHPHTVSADNVVTLRAILRAFYPDTSDSRLILTSRYRFTLPDSSGYGDLATKLYPLQPPPMPDGTRSKLTLRQTQQITRDSSQATLVNETDFKSKSDLLDRTEKVACGNPGLQELLTGLVFAPGANDAGTEKTLNEMEAYLTGQNNKKPNEENIQEF